METIKNCLQEEYALATERKRSLLAQSGVVEGDLSKTGQMNLHVLADVAEILQLKDTRTSSYWMAASDLIRQVDDVDEMVSAVKKDAADAQQASQELADESKDLDHVTKQLEEATNEREGHENTTTMAQRTAEYKERERTYEMELRSLGATLSDLKFDDLRDGVEHHSLAALERACEEIEASNTDLRNQLGRFHGLPLHTELAAATLRHAQEDLAQLEDEFNRHIRAMV